MIYHRATEITEICIRRKEMRDTGVHRNVVGGVLLLMIAGGLVMRHLECPTYLTGALIIGAVLLGLWLLV